MKHNRSAEIAAPLEGYDYNWTNTPVRWTGAALGAEVSLVLDAPRLVAEAALQHAVATLQQMEQMFNLYSDDSLLGQLNATGHLANPPAPFLDLCDHVTRVHVATGGLFDPTIQPLWRSLSDGDNPSPARASVGWKHVEVSTREIRLKPGQKISFNGIGQGFATDLVTEALRTLGIRQALIQIGELAVIGGPFDLRLAPPGGHRTRKITLKDSAICVSRPRAHLVGNTTHILHPKGLPFDENWAMVICRSTSASLADACATAFTMMTRVQIEKARDQIPELDHITLIAEGGETVELGSATSAD